MKILYMGIGSKKLEERALLSDHQVITVETIESLTVELTRPSLNPVVTINDLYNTSNFDAFVLNDSSSNWDTLYAHTSTKYWLCNPFDYRNSCNKNLQYAKARNCLKTFPLYGKFENGTEDFKVQYPGGYEVPFLVLFDKVIPLGNNVAKINTHTHRMLKRFMFSLGLSVGVISLFKSFETGSYYFNEFSPFIHWSTLSDSQVDYAIEYLNFESANRLKRI